MKLRNTSLALAALLLVFGTAGFAQGEQIYLQDEADSDGPGWAVGIGFGLVELGDNVVEGQRIISDDSVESYLTLNLRIPFGDRNAHGGSSSGGFRAYIEPELAVWESDVQSDTLFGINIIGGMPMNAVEFFVGGGIGMHFIDNEDLLTGDSVITGTSDEAIGVNAQFGVDVNLSQSVALFGVGRFDLIDDTRDELEGKAYVGIRFRF